MSSFHVISHSNVLSIDVLPPGGAPKNNWLRRAQPEGRKRNLPFEACAQNKLAFCEVRTPSRPKQAAVPTPDGEVLGQLLARPVPPHDVHVQLLLLGFADIKLGVPLTNLFGSHQGNMFSIGVDHPDQPVNPREAVRSRGLNDGLRPSPAHPTLVQKSSPSHYLHEGTLLDQPASRKADARPTVQPHKFDTFQAAVCANLPALEQVG
mmetsp:Transcript_29481/g.50908  ORF Transcript_29481/g.50908 Transcript_29481/m.50908 type:complete len:207 (+) Transcript_29481:1196-1816(+)